MSNLHIYALGVGLVVTGITAAIANIVLGISKHGSTGNLVVGFVGLFVSASLAVMLSHYNTFFGVFI